MQAILEMARNDKRADRQFECRHSYRPGIVRTESRYTITLDCTSAGSMVEQEALCFIAERLFCGYATRRTPKNTTSLSVQVVPWTHAALIPDQKILISTEFVSGRQFAHAGIGMCTCHAALSLPAH